MCINDVCFIKKIDIIEVAYDVCGKGTSIRVMKPRGQHLATFCQLACVVARIL